MVTVGRTTIVLVFPISPNFAFILRPFWDGPMKKLLVCAEVFPRIWIKSDSWVSWHLLRHLVDRVKYQPPSQTTLRQKPTLVKFPTICAPRNCPEINCTLQSGLVHYIRICGNLNAEGLSGHARNLWTLMNHVFSFAPPPRWIGPYSFVEVVSSFRMQSFDYYYYTGRMFVSDLWNPCDPDLSLVFSSRSIRIEYPGHPGTLRYPVIRSTNDKLVAQLDYHLFHFVQGTKKCSIAMC